MQRNFVHRSSYNSKNRWMYIPDYREPLRINWKELVIDVLIACPLAAALVLVIIKAAETL